MKKLIIIASLLFVLSTIFALPNGTYKYKKLLRDGDDKFIDDTLKIIVALWTDSTAGSREYCDTVDVDVVNGRLSVYLENLESIGMSSQMFWELAISSDDGENYDTLSRVRLTAEVVAIHALNVPQGGAKVYTESPITGDGSSGSKIDITANALDSTHIGNNAVTTNEIKNATIIAGDIATSAITSAKILNSTIVNEDISASAEIGVGKLGNAGGTEGQVPTISGNNVVWSDVSQGSGENLTDGNGLGGGIYTGAVAKTWYVIGDNKTIELGGANNDSVRVKVNSLDSVHIKTNAVRGWHIKDGTIGAADIASQAVSSIKILNNTITADDIATGGVATAEIANGTIINEDISNSAEIAVSKIKDGNAGQVLTTDGTNVSWGNVSSINADLTAGAGLSGTAYDGSVARTFNILTKSPLVTVADSIKLNHGNGLQLSGSNLIVKAHTGITVDANGVSINLANLTDGNGIVDFTYDGTGAQTVSVDPDSGISVSANGMKVKLIETTNKKSGLEFAPGGELKVSVGTPVATHTNYKLYDF